MAESCIHVTDSVANFSPLFRSTPDLHGLDRLQLPTTDPRLKTCRFGESAGAHNAPAGRNSKRQPYGLVCACADTKGSVASSVGDQEKALGEFKL